MSNWDSVASGDPAGQPPLKRTRAKRSCDLCRKRKTRCNADRQQPCETCKNANVECQFLVEQRKRGPSATTNQVQSLEDRLRRLEGLLQETRPDRELADQLGELKLTDYGQTRYIGSSAGHDGLNEQLLSSNRQYRLQHSPSHVLQKVNGESNEHIIMISKVLSRQKDDTPYAIRRHRALLDIPHMTQELADAMIYAFFQCVHIHFPILNKISFLEQYYFENPHPPDEHLLYAVCAVATQFMANEQDWITPGQAFTRNTLLVIQRELRRKTEKILENVHRKSKLSTVQTLILMIVYTDIERSEEETSSMRWFVCGIAIRMAQDIGLHRSSRNWKMPENEIELRRRVWYGLYILDREVAAQFGRPITILDDSFDVELPSMYELESTHESHMRDPEFQSFTPSLIIEAQAAVQSKKPVYDTFHQLISISRILGHVLSSMYSPKNEYIASKDDYLVTAIGNELARWKENLPQHLIFNPDEPLESTMIQAANLSIHYNCMLLLLHRPFLSNENSGDLTVVAQALSTCTSAAINIVDTVNVLESKGIPAVSWCFVAYATFQTAGIFLFNARSECRSIRQQGAEYLSWCASAFRKDESLRNGVHAHILSVLATTYSSFDDQSVVPSKWKLEPVLEADSSIERYQKSTDSPSFGDTSDAGLFYKALPYDNGTEQSAREVSSEPQPVSSTLSPTPQVPVGSDSSYQGFQPIFDVENLTVDFNVLNAIQWNDWNQSRH